MNRSLAALALLCAAALSSCDKNTVQQLPLGPVAASRIRFVNFGVKAPGVNFYANSTKMTAVLSSTNSEATTGVVYLGAGNAGLYSAIAPGQYSLTGRIAATTDKDLPIDAFTGTLADGKVYSFYLSGFYNATTKMADAFLVEDPVPAQLDYSVAYVRLVHAISNANPLTLYARLTGDTVTAHWAAVGGTVAYKGAGAFATVPFGIYDLGARDIGSASNKISLAGVSLVGGRVYTIGAAGYDTVTTVVRDTLIASLHQ